MLIHAYDGCLHVVAESGGVRPFGVSLLMAGYDENGPQLYQIDPSGSFFAWKASAMGKNMVCCAFCDTAYVSLIVLVSMPIAFCASLCPNALMFH